MNNRSAANLQIGDLVRLRIPSSVLMLIEEIYAWGPMNSQERFVRCMWTENNVLQTKDFYEPSLLWVDKDAMSNQRSFS